MKRLVCIAMLVLLFADRPALGCQCAGKPTVVEQYAEASIVFVGKVEAVADRWSPFSKVWLKIRRWFNEDAQPSINLRRYCTDYGMQVLFSVERSWKGVSASEIMLFTGRGSGDCGVEFQVGERYVVYAYPRVRDGCQTNICTRTREITLAQEDLKVLGRYPTRKFP